MDKKQQPTDDMETLKQLIDDVQSVTEENSSTNEISDETPQQSLDNTDANILKTYEESLLEQSTETSPSIQVLDLPPRREVHTRRSSRINFKVGRPLLRFLIVCLIIVAGLVGAYYLWGDEFINRIIHLT